jgi:hypothetical protein
MITPVLWVVKGVRKNHAFYLGRSHDNSFTSSAKPGIATSEISRAQLFTAEHLAYAAICELENDSSILPGIEFFVVGLGIVEEKPA